MADWLALKTLVALYSKSARITIVSSLLPKVSTAKALVLCYMYAKLVKSLAIGYHSVLLANPLHTPLNLNELYQ